MTTNVAWTQIKVKNKLYGYDASSVADANQVVDIRSETNPFKTPYLKVGSKTYIAILAAVQSNESLIPA